jgi:hypothetical protein
MPGTVTGIYSAKGAFFDRLAFIKATTSVFNGVTIAYDEPPADAELSCIYGGGVRFQQENPFDNYGLLITEDSSFGVYIRYIDRPPTSVRETDAKVAALATKLIEVMIDNADLGAGHTWRGIGRGQGDYTNTDDETISRLALEVKIGSQFSMR